MLKTQALMSFYQEHHQIVQNQPNKPLQEILSAIFFHQIV